MDKEKLVHPFRRVAPMECPCCGRTMTVFEIETNVCHTTKMGEPIVTENFFTTMVAKCMCGYETPVFFMYGFYVPDTPFYRNIEAQADLKMELKNQKLIDNIFDAKVIEDELVRRYG